MTLDQFKQAVDTLDTGLPQRPDLVSIRAEGRAVRRRRRGVAVASGLAAAALVAVPLGLAAAGFDDGSAQVADDTSVSPSPTPSASPAGAPLPYADQSQRMTTSVTDVFPQAALTRDDFYDSKVALDNGDVGIRLGDAPDWGSVFRWNQEFAFDDLQHFNVSASWEDSLPGMRWCSGRMFADESDCSVTDLDGGWLLVQHDGVRMKGEDDGDWSRFVQLVSPPSERGSVQLVEVWAQEEDMTWPQADAVLPPLSDLATIATDARMRLPEPISIPEPE